MFLNRLHLSHFHHHKFQFQLLEYHLDPNRFCSKSEPVERIRLCFKLKTFSFSFKRGSLFDKIGSSQRTAIQHQPEERPKDLSYSRTRFDSKIIFIKQDKPIYIKKYITKTLLFQFWIDKNVLQIYVPYQCILNKI